MAKRSPEMLSDKELLEQWQEDKKDALEGANNWRQESIESYDFYHGDQWDRGDMKILADQNRPAITFNRIKPFVQVVVGTMIQTRGQPKYMAREASDRPRADLFQSAASWGREVSNAEHHETKAAKDMLICGIGCTDERTSYDNGLIAGYMVKERVYPLEMWSDPRARQMNLLDARFHFRVRHLTRRDFMDMFDKDPVKIGAGREEFALTAKNYYDGERWMRRTGDYTAVEYQYRQKEPFFWTANPLFNPEAALNQMPGMDIDGLKELQGALGGLGMDFGEVAGQQVYQQFGQQFRKNMEEPVLILSGEEKRILTTMLAEQNVALKTQTAKMWKYYRAFISGEIVLKHTTGPLPDGFSWKFMTGDYDDENACWYGIVRPMKDPSRYANKAFSQHLHIINSNPKGGIIIERGATDNIGRLEKQYSRSDSVVVVNDGAISKGKIKDKATPTQSTGYELVLNIAQGAHREVTGINLELLGQANREQAGVLEATRIQQGMTVLAEYLDSMKLYLKESGRATVHFLRELAQNVDGLLIRVVGSEEGKYARLFEDDIAPYYDIVMGDAPKAPNQDAEDFISLIDAVQKGALPPTPSVRAAIVDKAPMRQALKDKILEEIKQQEAAQGQQQAGMADMAQQIAVAEKKAGIDNKNADTFKKQQEAALTAAQAAEKGQEVKARAIVSGVSP